MNRVVHFEIAADDPQRAILFYQKVFGWTFKKWEDSSMEYWLVMTGPKEEPGIDGGLMRRQKTGTCECGDSCDCNGAYVCTIGVNNLDEMLKKVTDNGGTVVKPKAEVMKVGWLAYCKDTEGNLFGMMQWIPGAMM